MEKKTLASNVQCRNASITQAATSWGWKMKQKCQQLQFFKWPLVIGSRELINRYIDNPILSSLVKTVLANIM